MKNISSKLRIFIATFIAVMAPVFVAYAVVQTLNGQTGNTQTFSNDTNVTISSASNVHTLGWTGALSPARGGTGTSTWQTGSIPFFDGARLTEDAGLKYDAVAGWMTVGRVGGGLIQSRQGATADQLKSDMEILAGTPIPGITANGGTLDLFAGGASSVGYGGEVDIAGGVGEGADYVGGNIDIEAGPGGSNARGGDLILDAGDGSTIGQNGQIKLKSGVGLPAYAILDTTNITSSDKLFYFPDRSGVLPLLQGAASSTIQIGDIKSCIVMADSDGVGVTYVTANDGVLSATTTQPSNCQ